MSWQMIQISTEEFSCKVGMQSPKDINLFLILLTKTDILLFVHLNICSNGTGNAKP